MDFKKIDKKNCLLGIIGFLFLIIIVFAVCIRTADSIHKELRLRIDTFDVDKTMRSYKYNCIYFSLKDSIIADGFSKGYYLAFEEDENGFDIPLSISYFPSFIHPSTACISGSRSERTNNINKLLEIHSFTLKDSVAYFGKLIIQMATERNATICAIIPSYSSHKTYDYDIFDGYFGRGEYSDLEIDGIRLSKLVNDDLENPEWIVDSLMVDIYRELEAYCGNEHCNVGNDYVDIIVNSLKEDKVDGFNYLCKREKARTKIKNWLEFNQQKIKQLAKGCPDMLNAASQLLDDYHWINQENHERVCTLFAKLDTVSYKEKQSVTNQICDEIGYKVPKVDNTTTQSKDAEVLADDDEYEDEADLSAPIRFERSMQYRHLEFWQKRWKDGDAEWTKKWLKSIAE